jgi:leader peptidase (prepilin peptidase) / N-methyltransferase
MIIIAILGLALGSFVNALVWRLRQQETAKDKKATDKYSITKGRSQCTRCGHKLSAGDMIPVASWLLLRGRCRYCEEPISWQYPLVELATATLFVLSYVYWPAFQGPTLETADVIGFGVWLVLLTGLIALVVYDLRWMLLPNRIIFPLIYWIVLGVILQSIVAQDIGTITSAALGAAVGGGLFYGIFQLSGGRWIGGGDVKLGFLLGAAVGGPWLALLMLFLASLLGSVVSLPLLVFGKAKRSTRIPFGPFLVAAAIVSLLFGQDIINWYMNLYIV